MKGKHEKKQKSKPKSTSTKSKKATLSQDDKRSVHATPQRIHENIKLLEEELIALRKDIPTNYAIIFPLYSILNYLKAYILKITSLQNQLLKHSDSLSSRDHIDIRQLEYDMQRCKHLSIRCKVALLEVEVAHTQKDYEHYNRELQGDCSFDTLLQMHQIIKTEIEGNAIPLNREDLKEINSELQEFQHENDFDSEFIQISLDNITRKIHHTERTFRDLSQSILEKITSTEINSDDVRPSNIDDESILREHDSSLSRSPKNDTELSDPDNIAKLPDFNNTPLPTTEPIEPEQLNMMANQSTSSTKEPALFEQTKSRPIVFFRSYHSLSLPPSQKNPELLPDPPHIGFFRESYPQMPSFPSRTASFHKPTFRKNSEPKTIEGFLHQIYLLKIKEQNLGQSFEQKSKKEIQNAIASFSRFSNTIPLFDSLFIDFLSKSSGNIQTAYKLYMEHCDKNPDPSEKEKTLFTQQETGTFIEKIPILDFSKSADSNITP